MYRAKPLGKSRHEVFDKGMHTHAVNLLHLETDLRRALDWREFNVYSPARAQPRHAGRRRGVETEEQLAQLLALSCD
jgi:hypothetical protein